LRRTDQIGEPLVFGDIVLDPVGHQVTRAGHPLDLTPLEFDLLACLLRNPHEAFTREKLLERVWGYHHHGDTRLVNVHMARLRSKIEDDADNPQVIRTVRGIGYQAIIPD
jgi:two-component system response regulator MtrA